MCGFQYSAGIIRQRSIFTKRWGPEAFSGVCKLPLEAWDKDMVENRNENSKNSNEQEQFKLNFKSV